MLAQILDDSVNDRASLHDVIRDLRVILTGSLDLLFERKRRLCLSGGGGHRLITYTCYVPTRAVIMHVFIKSCNKNNPSQRGCFYNSLELSRKFDVFGDFFDQALLRFVGLDTGSNRNLAPDDDVFFEAVEAVSTPANCGVDQYPGRILEGSSG
jgi:hypothetical protein